MEINKNHTLTFQSKYICRIQTVEKMKNGKYFKIPTHCIKIQPEMEMDYFAFKQLYNTWQDKIVNKLSWDFDFLQFIQSQISEIYHKELKTDDKRELYAITSQNKNYKQLDENKVLAIAFIDNSKDRESDLQILLTNPDFSYDKGQNREYKKIGSAMLKGLKMALNQPIRLLALPSLTNFYTENGFKKVSQHKDEFLWESTHSNKKMNLRHNKRYDFTKYVQH